MFVGYFIAVMPSSTEYPHNLLLTVLGLFPLTAPVVMMMRLTVGGVPLWQPLIAVLLLFFTVFYVMRMVARMFERRSPYGAVVYHETVFPFIFRQRIKILCVDYP